MVKDTTDEYINIEIFQGKVNINLFNEVIAFVMATSAEETLPIHKNLTEKHLWYSQTSGNTIQERYGFRYFGELLERFEENFDSNITDIRAIALAMAYTKVFSDDMFIGNQKNNFIRKIKQSAESDIYLKGALYLLSENETERNGYALASTAYAQIDELILVMTLHENFEQDFTIFKPQLIELLGNKRIMPVNGNMPVYAWLIKQLQTSPKIKQIRTKDMTLFKALLELPNSFVKAGSRHHTVLLDNGYTTEEIIYLNSFIVRCKTISNTMDIYSIKAEKIAVEMCKIFIGSKNNPSQDVYEHLGWLMKKYKNFEIKIGGCEGIYEAIKDDVNIINPKMFLWLFNFIEHERIDTSRDENRTMFRFDILDEKWDILSCELEANVYRDLFDKQLELNLELTEIQIIESIKKYGELTGTSYLSQFEVEYIYAKRNIFALLVDKGIIDLIETFSSCNFLDSDVEEPKSAILRYICEYILGIHSRKAFEFFKYFLSKYDFNDMQLLIGKYENIDRFFMDKFYTEYSSYNARSRRFEIERLFLSDDEHRELFSWLDDYMFQYKSDKYMNFTASILIDPFIVKFFNQEELRSIYDMVRDMNIDLIRQNSHVLKRRFLTEYELQAEHDAEEIQKQLELEQKMKELRDELTTKYNDTFESLLVYLDVHKYSYSNRDKALLIAGEYLDVTLSEKNHVLNQEEMGRFLLFSGKILQEGLVDFATLKNHILMLKEDVKYDENN